MITERDILILAALVQYYVLNRQQIQHLIFPNDPDGRITRRRLQMLYEEHYINKQPLRFAHPTVPPAPVYFPSRRGCDVLAEHFEDDRYLLTPTEPPINHHVLHWLAISDTHIALNEATETADVKVEGWVNEWDVVNKNETLMEKRFKLYTLLRDNPRLVCVPDAGFMLSAKGHKKVFSLEQDRGTSGVQQIANSKTAGYAEMAQRQSHLRHFPESTLSSFSVLMVAPSPKRRDNLRRAIASKPGASLWRFVAAGDLVPDRLLYEPIFYACDSDEPKPLVKRDMVEA